MALRVVLSSVHLTCRYDDFVLDETTVVTLDQTATLASHVRHRYCYFHWPNDEQGRLSLFRQLAITKFSVVRSPLPFSATFE